MASYTPEFSTPCGPERVAMNKQLAALTDDETRELIALGRERGMPVLQPPPSDSLALSSAKADDPVATNIRG